LNLLPATTITTAVSATVTPWAELNGTPRNLTVQVNFVYGSGGTTVDVYLQTSLDGKQTATDVAHFAFTTASARFGCNLTTYAPQGTPLSGSVPPDYRTPVAPLTDGALGAGMARDGILGPWIRCKVSSTGLYSGNTTLQVDVESADIPAFP
jgi:hypothetical protein